MPGDAIRGATDFSTGRSVEGQGLAGSAADRLAGGAGPAVGSRVRGRRRPLDPHRPVPTTIWLDSSSRPGPGRVVERRAGQRLPAADANRTPASSQLDAPVGGRDPGPGMGGDAPLRGLPDDPDTGRAAGPARTRIAVFAGALAIAAVALFMLPALLGIGGGRRGTRQPSASRPVATAQRRATTPVPEPSAQVYIIKSGDTLSKVAKRFGVTLEELLAANPDIKNPDKIAIGQQIVIPMPARRADARAIRFGLAVSGVAPRRAG